MRHIPGPSPLPAGQQTIELRRSALSPVLPQDLPPAQAAAALYADGREADAGELLYRMLEPGGSEAANPQLWAMLFDLLRARGEWARYERLGTGFQQVFGTPPPQWLNEDDMARLPAELRPGAAGYFEFAGALDGNREIEFQAVREGARNLATVHLDLSRLSGLNDEGCNALTELLRFLPGNGNGVLLTGSDHFVDVLHEAADSNSSVEAYWDLLLELCRVRGEQIDFERIALEYALAVGTEPPAWQAMVMPLTANTSPQEKRDQPRYQAGPEIISVSGMMWGAGDRQLTKVRAFAEERQYVNIDLSQLKRLDFGCGGAFATLINELTASGKTVRLLRPNSLVAAFLVTFDLDPRIAIVPPRSGA